MKKENRFILDTSAIFCLQDNEDGAAKVAEILENKKNQIYLSFMSLMEYLYISLMKQGEEFARKSYLQLTLLPIAIVESDEDLRVLAAELKAAHDISVADAWIAATALKLNGTLVHRDPEFDSLNHKVNCLSLPYKRKCNQ